VVALCLLSLVLAPGRPSTGSVLAAGAHNHVDMSIVPVPLGKGVTTTPKACRHIVGKCVKQMLAIINRDRAEHGLRRLTLLKRQSVGTWRCVGSYRHSVAMAESSALWHVNPKYPRASFPRSICEKYMHTGENVGESESGDALNDLKVVENLMMSEPHGKRLCAAEANHACNILNPLFHHVGIGIYYSLGITWITEDFVN
jgi:uncharacterized protein YkwD